MIDNFEYIGLFLTPESKAVLLNYLKEIGFGRIISNPEKYKVYLDHVTLIHKSQVKYEVDELLVNKYLNEEGREYNITITDYGYSDKVTAFKVDLNLSGLMSINPNPHIIIITFNSGKPVDSSKIINWKPLSTPLIIKTVLNIK